MTIAFFSLFGFIFLITQFFQFVRDYTPLEAGVRTIPVAASIAVASILGGVLAPRLGTKAVVATGLALLGTSFGWIAASEVDIDYATTIVPQMVLMGLGLGLVSTPATESILQVLPPARAGIGSAVNDATRELGGTLGVAVIGSVFSSVYASRLAEVLTGQVPDAQLEAAEESVGVAAALGQQVPALEPLLDGAFMDALSAGCTVISVLCLIGAVGALLALPGRRWQAPGAAPHADPDADPDAEPEGQYAVRSV